MIVFDLSCPVGHRFEGWFASSDAFEEQRRRGLGSCPDCGAQGISKAPMAPAVAHKGKAALPSHTAIAPGSNVPEGLQRAMTAFMDAQTRALRSSTWVGDRFADEARAQHYGDSDSQPIHGRATKDDARTLADEGIAVAPIVVPFVPPDEIN